MKKSRLKSCLVIGLILSSLTSSVTVFADLKVINSIKETTDSKSGIKTVTEIQKLSDGSVKQIQTQSDGYVIDDTYYSDGSGIEKIYRNGQVSFTDKYQSGQESSVYKTLEERLSSQADPQEEMAYDNQGYKTNNSGNFSDVKGESYWKQDENGKWYWIENGVMATGWRVIQSTSSNTVGKNTKYYFKENGEMNVGWLEVGGNWFYCVPTSQQSNPTLAYMPTGSIFVSDIAKINGVFYAFSPVEGKLKVNADGGLSVHGKYYKYNTDSNGEIKGIDSILLEDYDHYTF